MSEQVSTANPAAIMPAAREAFFAQFREHALRTARVVKLFEDKDLSIKPGEGSMSLADQINHICASHNFIRGLLEQEPTMDLFHRQYDVSSVAAAVKSVVGGIEEVRKAAEAVTAERWEQTVAPFGPDWAMSRGQLAFVMVEHEVHHAGQLHVYARIAGKVPPMLYAPVDEKALG